MQLFISNQEVEQLEFQLIKSKDQETLQISIALAWHLRQRNSARSLQFAMQAESQLLHNSPVPQQQLYLARLKLCRAEIAGLEAQLNLAETLIHEAILVFQIQQDPLGLGDAKWLLSFIYHDQGNVQLRDDMMNAALLHYRQSNDQVRIDTAIARQLLIHASYDAKFINHKLLSNFQRTSYTPATLAWLSSAFGCMDSNTDSPGKATKILLDAHYYSLESGQIRQAIVTACNSADSFASLGDLDTALKLDESAIQLARQTGWPCSIGFSLLQTANVLRLLGRLHDAKTALYQAIEIMQNLSACHAYMMALMYLGEVLLDLAEPEQALDYFSRAEQQSTALRDVYYLLRSWRGQATALCRLGQAQAAIVKAEEALFVAKQQYNLEDQILIYQVYAELHQRYQLSPPDQLCAPNAELHYLKLALNTAAEISDYLPPARIHTQIASAYATLGEYQLAYQHSVAASTIGERSSLVNARNRAIAMQISQENALIQQETQTRLALAQRALELEQQRVTAADKAALQANLRTLQAQIEPHFLFNSLANVLSLIHAEPDTAKTMLEKFIAYLRASLASSREQESNLYKEFQLMRNFLGIFQVRMGERLSCQIELPEELASHAFPSMLLQPLVENSIKHGLEPKIEGGTIQLQAYREHQMLVVRVCDSGLGFQPHAKSGIGLSNACERIEKIFNGHASLLIEESHPCGTSISIRIPFAAQESESQLQTA